MHAAALRLRQRLTHDLRRNPGDLDIHLQRGDPLPRPRNFKIHVAVMIFGPGNVAQDRILVAFLHQPHCDARDRSG